ncbi:hypothetical protein H634G_11116 [Metarhizium anisopliae BRIP 53293]|uniref:Uncharacterized protein n=1 Tax=Metarhizium anisopliae BRIP 53293 TaxID=1291518 RepID=A0A0D9NHW8_METAN|nr:hypothetical protein H634G_11116 [Metarhizium anisopliae BRIP 53293]
MAPPQEVGALSERPSISSAFEIGTSHFGAAFTVENGEPTMLQRGRVSGGTGTYDRVPNAFRCRDGQLEPLSYDQIMNYDEIGFGFKQALDRNLHEKGGQAFLDFLRKNEKTLLECLKLIFAHFLTDLDNLCRKEKYGPLTKVSIPVPVMWTEDENGKEIQKLIALGATEAGFDSNILDFTTEPEAASDYIKYLHRKAVQEEQEAMLLQQRKVVQQTRRRKQPTAPRKGKSKRVLVMDIGAGLAHFDLYEMHDRYMLLISRNYCVGGMDHAWPSLLRRCREETESIYFFKDAKAHVESQCESPWNDFISDGMKIPGEDLWRIVEECYKKPLDMAENEIRNYRVVDKVVLMGTALIENKSINSFWMRRIDEVKKNCGKHNLQVEVLDTVNAVCLGASLPSSNDPTELFWKQGFGYAVAVDRATGEVIVQAKTLRTHTCLKYWETVMPDNDMLVLKLYAFDASVKRRSDWSRDSNRHVYSKRHAVPMGQIDVKLESHVETVMVRFTYQPPGLITLQVRHRQGWKTEVDLELSFDGKILQIQTTGRTRDVPWEETDGKEHGKTSSSRKPGKQHSRADQTTDKAAIRPPRTNAGKRSAALDPTLLEGTKRRRKATGTTRRCGETQRDPYEVPSDADEGTNNRGHVCARPDLRANTALRSSWHGISQDDVNTKPYAEMEGNSARRTPNERQDSQVAEEGDEEEMNPQERTRRNLGPGKGRISGEQSPRPRTADQGEPALPLGEESPSWRILRQRSLGTGRNGDQSPERQRRPSEVPEAPPREDRPRRAFSRKPTPELATPGHPGQGTSPQQADQTASGFQEHADQGGGRASEEPQDHDSGRRRPSPELGSTDAGIGSRVPETSQQANIRRQSVIGARDGASVHPWGRTGLSQRSPRAAENMVGIEGDNAEHYTLSETGSAMDEAGYQLHHELYQANGSDLQARPTVPYDVVGTDKDGTSLVHRHPPLPGTRLASHDVRTARRGTSVKRNSVSREIGSVGSNRPVGRDGHNGNTLVTDGELSKGTAGQPQLSQPIPGANGLSSALNRRSQRQTEPALPSRAMSFANILTRQWNGAY